MNRRLFLTLLAGAGLAELTGLAELAPAASATRYFLPPRAGGWPLTDLDHCPDCRTDFGGWVLPPGVETVCLVTGRPIRWMIRDGIWRQVA